MISEHVSGSDVGMLKLNVRSKTLEIVNLQASMEKLKLTETSFSEFIINIPFIYSKRVDVDTTGPGEAPLRVVPFEPLAPCLEIGSPNDGCLLLGKTSYKPGLFGEIWKPQNQLTILPVLFRSHFYHHPYHEFHHRHRYHCCWTI